VKKNKTPKTYDRQIVVLKKEICVAKSYDDIRTSPEPEKQQFLGMYNAQYMFRPKHLISVTLVRTIDNINVYAQRRHCWK